MPSFVFKIAKSNKKLSQDHYKEMIKNSKLIKNKMPLWQFKEAFHSKNTPPEYRSLLLSSLYRDKPDFSRFIRSNIEEAANLSKIVLSPKIGKDGKNFFSLTGKVDRTSQYIKLTDDVKRHISNWEPKNLGQRLLNKALASNNVQFQKITMALENISRCLYDLAHISKDFAFMNDPLGIYYKNSLKATYSKTGDLGFFANSAQIYKRDIEHLYGEFDKYINVLNKMGISTQELEVKISEIHQHVSEFAEGGHRNTQDEIVDLYEIHDKSAPLIESIIDVVDKLESLTEYSPEIYAIKSADKIPAYVPYRDKNKIIERTYDAVESRWGIVDRLNELWTKVKR